MPLETLATPLSHMSSSSGSLRGFYEVSVPGQYVFTSFTPQISFSKQLPVRLRGRMTQAEFRLMVSEIEKRLNQGIADANHIFARYNTSAVLGTVFTLGVGAVVLWPLWVVGSNKSSAALAVHLDELNQWIDEQNNKYWNARHLQFNLLQDVTTSGGDQAPTTTTSFMIQIEVAPECLTSIIGAVSDKEVQQL